MFDIEDIGTKEQSYADQNPDKFVVKTETSQYSNLPIPMLILPNGQYNLPIKHHRVKVTDKTYNQWKNILTEIIENTSIKTKQEFEEIKRSLAKKYKLLNYPDAYSLLWIYRMEICKKNIEVNQRIESILLSKTNRSRSGILNVTIQLDPFGNNPGNMTYGTKINYDTIMKNKDDPVILGNLLRPYLEISEDNNGNKKAKLLGTSTCNHNCSYCTTYPLLNITIDDVNLTVHWPKSYAPGENSTDRALRNNFDPFRQVHDTIMRLYNQGHTVVGGKGEFIIEGGTWENNNKCYRHWLVTMLYYACNTMFINRGRPVMSLTEEREENRRTDIDIFHMIGLTIETRPDEVDPESLIEYRRLGVTRVQMGVQSTVRSVLAKSKRGCFNNDTIRATWLLKNSGFKVDYHIMFGLPGSSIENDKITCDMVLNDPDYSHDQAKLYPVIVLNHTELKELYDKGEYIPWFEHDESCPYLTENDKMNECVCLLKILSYYESNCHEWIRINREQRDFHEIAEVQYDITKNKQTEKVMIGGSTKSNLRQILSQYMKQHNLEQKEIRSREIGNRSLQDDKILLHIIKYVGSGGTEVFLQYVLEDNTILGFLRLRMSTDSGCPIDKIPYPNRKIKKIIKDMKVQGKTHIFPELINCAMIRELHIYGTSTAVSNDGIKIQHRGFGTKLISKASDIAIENGYDEISVISGTGVEKYYENRGFSTNTEQYYMHKKLTNPTL